MYCYTVDRSSLEKLKNFCAACCILFVTLHCICFSFFKVVISSDHLQLCLLLPSEASIHLELIKTCYKQTHQDILIRAQSQVYWSDLCLYLFSLVKILHCFYPAVKFCIISQWCHLIYCHHTGRAAANGWTHSDRAGQWAATDTGLTCLRREHAWWDTTNRCNDNSNGSDHLDTEYSQSLSCLCLLSLFTQRCEWWE